MKDKQEEILKLEKDTKKEKNHKINKKILTWTSCTTNCT